MQAIAYVISIMLGMMGLIFIVGSQGLALRIVIGFILIGAGALLVILTKMRPKETNINLTQKIDLSGDVHLEKMHCSSCGAELSDKSVTVKAGGIFVTCEYCGSTYQVEEEAKF